MRLVTSKNNLNFNSQGSPVVSDLDRVTQNHVTLKDGIKVKLYSSQKSSRWHGKPSHLEITCFKL